MFSPPTTNHFNHPLARFILSGEWRYRLLRHALLIGVIGFQFAGSYINGQVDLALNWGLAVNVCLFVLMLTLVYTNIYVLVPRLLWPGRFAGYVGAVLALIVIFWLGVMACIVMAPRGTLAIDYQLTLSFVNFLDTILLPLVFVGATTGLQVFRRWANDVRRISELETRQLREELTQLKSQINPHFLFNTLNNLEVLTRKDPDKASQILFALSDILRYQLHESDRESVVLTRDIENIRQILTLETVRRDQFTFTITVGEDLDRQTVAPFLFMPFVENAIKHSATSSGPSFVRLCFAQENGQLVFCAENSKPAWSVAASVGGLGLKNSCRRLQLLYPNRHTLTLTSTDAHYSARLVIDV